MRFLHDSFLWKVIQPLLEKIKPKKRVTCFCTSDRENILCKIIKTETDASYEGFFIETNLRKKWLLSCSYKPHKNNNGTHLQTISKTLDKLSTSYDDIILYGEFYVKPEEATYLIRTNFRAY